MISGFSASNYKRTLVAAVWGCSHDPADIANGRSSTATAIANLESTKCSKIDFAIALGDFSANQNPSELASYSTEGANCSLQLNSGTIKLPRHKIYTIPGNHDAGDMNYNWYNRYIDDWGNNTAYSGVNQSLRPYPMNGQVSSTGGTDYYSFQTGNVLWLILGDRNEGAQNWGRSGGTGGFPAMCVALTTYQWWENMVLNNQDKIIITCSHAGLKETTIATGIGEGVSGGYHGNSGGANGTSMLYHVVDESNGSYETDTTRFHDLLTAHPGYVSVWAAAHTHYTDGSTMNGRGPTATRYGCLHVNVNGLTKYHGSTCSPQNRMFQFTEGSNILLINTFLHDTGYQNLGYNGSPISVTLPYNYTP